MPGVFVSGSYSGVLKDTCGGIPQVHVFEDVVFCWWWLWKLGSFQIAYGALPEEVCHRCLILGIYRLVPFPVDLFCCRCAVISQVFAPSSSSHSSSTMTDSRKSGDTIKYSLLYIPLGHGTSSFIVTKNVKLQYSKAMAIVTDTDTRWVFHTWKWYLGLKSYEVWKQQYSPRRVYLFKLL